MTDLVTFGETMLRLSPPAGVRLETTRELGLHVGGAESNVAAAASSLGLDSAWLSKLPRSPLGRRITRELHTYGVDTAIAWDDSDDARLGTYYVEPGGEPRGTDVVYDRANASITTVSFEELPTDALEGATYLYTSGITPALSADAAETCRTLLETAQDVGSTTAFDLNYRSKLWSPAEAREGYRTLFPHVDVLVAARRDAAAVLGRDGDASEVARGLASDYGFDTVVVTCGDDGALALRDDEIHEQPIYEAETFDPIGTGDSFVGGYLAKRSTGDSTQEALQWGAATAALNRTVAGDLAVVTREEVERVIREESGGIDR